MVQKMAIPVKMANSPRSDADSPINPATLFPSPVAAKYAPIIKAIHLSGANLVINDSATGDAHNSPMVWNKYANTSQYICDWPTLSYWTDAADIKKKPQPIIITPMPILNKEEDSRPLFFHQTHTLPTIVANIKMKIAFTDWNQLAEPSNCLEKDPFSERHKHLINLRLVQKHPKI